MYHRNADGSGTFQDFVTRSGEEVEVQPTAEEEEHKREMCLAYASQGDFLSHFRLSPEIARPQIAHDYIRPPHPGKTNYEVWQWSMTAQEVSQAFAAFLRTAAAQSSGK